MQYQFAFSFIGECCTSPHLWVQSATGKTEQDALKKALKHVTRNGNEVGDYVRLVPTLGQVSEVPE